jgi:phosphatidylserine synthase
MWGYGFGNGNTVSMVKFGYANAQNALLHWILQTGVLTTGLLSSVVVTVIGRVKRSPNVDRCMPMVLLIYLYVVLGIIEITFSMSFLLWVAALFMITCSKNDPNQQHMKRK